MTGTDLVVEIIGALATAEGVDTTELDYNLAEHIDPEVLTVLEGMDRGEWSFTFRVSDHQVTVTDELTVLVDGVSYANDLKKR